VRKIIVGLVTDLTVGLPSIAISRIASEDDIAVHAIDLIEDLDFSFGRDISSDNDAIASGIWQDVGSRSDAHEVSGSV